MSFEVFTRYVLLPTLLGLALWLGLYLVDSVGLDSQAARGRVYDKSYTAAWIQMIPVTAGKVTTYSQIHHPERWTVAVHVYQVDQVLNFAATRESFPSYQKDTEVHVRIAFGRLTDRVYGSRLEGVLQ